jgi:uncharacterized RDD family membrane protein YckC
MVFHEVITTERVPFQYRVAGVGSRVLAALIDLAIIVVLYLVGAVAGSVVEVGRAGLGQAVVFVWAFMLLWGYFMLFEWLWLGQTPGKWAVGLRVIREDGTSITLVQSAVRNIVRVVDLLPFAYGIGFVVAMCNREQRRLGDLAAGTLVVHLDRKVGPIRAVHRAQDVLPLAASADVRQRLSTLTREQRQTLLDLCLRRDQLRVSDRARLFQSVAQYMTQRYALSPAEFQSDEKFVLELVDAMSQGDRIR